MTSTNTKVDDDLVLELAGRGLSNVGIADEYGEITGRQIAETSVRRSLKRTHYQRHLIPVGLDVDARFRFDLERPLVLRNTAAMLTADWHIPLYDPAYVNEMIQRARSLGIKTLIVAGDFFNFDSLSSYDPKQSDADLLREYEEGLAVMRVLADTFDTIYYLWGNHDARLHRALGFAMKFREAMKMVFGALGEELMKKMVFTNLDHMWVEFDTEKGTERWYVCHPKEYSRVPLSNARQLANKYNSNVITAHSHHAAIGYAHDGKKVAAEAGGLFDARKTEYLQRSTTFPTWQQGYGWFDAAGHFVLTTKGWSTA